MQSWISVLCGLHQCVSGWLKVGKHRQLEYMCQLNMDCVKHQRNAVLASHGRIIAASQINVDPGIFFLRIITFPTLLPAIFLSSPLT